MLTTTTRDAVQPRDLGRTQAQPPFRTDPDPDPDPTWSRQLACPPTPRQCSRIAQRRAVLLLFLCLLLSVLALPAAIFSSPSAHAGAMHSASTNGQLQASIGQLLVPAIRYVRGYAQHYDEQCSATLVTLGHAPRSRLLLSAWHCIEDHRDLSRPVIFQSGDGQRLPAHLLASGGAMHADWALLRLPRDLPSPLPIDTVFEGGSGAVRMAGFPRNNTAPGLFLRDDCRITGHDGADLRTDCVLQKGASGGATLTVQGAPRFLGVISRGDGATQSIFVPVTRFLRHIRPYLGADPRPERAPDGGVTNTAGPKGKAALPRAIDRSPTHAA